MNNNQQPPRVAVSKIKGGPIAPNLTGEVMFEEIPDGVMVTVYVQGLPAYQPGSGNQKQVGPFGFHIHEQGSCDIGNQANPFQAAGEHWNPNKQPHGNHPGDFPVLFSNNGMAYMVFFTNRFKLDDIIGKSILIHQSPDDYVSQPAGDAGKRLACGLIQMYEYELRYY
jgi:Cu-Zn family superoxide dismutase